MHENQNIEYKETWHDDCLKSICGFANAQGGTLYIGIDNKGKTKGVSESQKLMEDLPNKIRDVLGIITEVNLKNHKKINYIEILVSPYSVPVSFRSRYYYRSGSTMQELKGTTLNKFLLKKSGKTWDDIIEPNATISDINEDSIREFLKAVEKSGRLPISNNLSTQELLEKLRVMENNYLKRAAVVLFGKDPGKFFPNMTVKIGRFGKSDDDLRFEETNEGNLIELLQAVPEQLNRKFFVKPITFEGLLRIEKGEYPVAALREMLLNALIHRDYMGSNIQIRMYDNRFCLWNEGGLPEGLTSESLKRQHPSRPRNPIIADVCFKGGYIDTWGRGTLKIIDACREAELPEPEIIEQDGGLLVTLFKKKKFGKKVREKSSGKKFGKKVREKSSGKILEILRKHPEKTIPELADILEISTRTVEKNISILQKNGKLRRVGSKKKGHWLVS